MFNTKVAILVLDELEIWQKLNTFTPDGLRLYLLRSESDQTEGAESASRAAATRTPAPCERRCKNKEGSFT